MTPGQPTTSSPCWCQNAAVSDVAPLDADFTFFGGLYRDVHAARSPIRFTSTRSTSRRPGVYVERDRASAPRPRRCGTRRARAQRRERRCSGDRRHASLVRADGTIAARSCRRTAASRPARRRLLTATATFANPHLWNGVADPYLYTVYVEVSVSGGAVTDVVSVPFGFRFVLRRRRAGLLAERPVPRSARRQPPSGPAGHGLGDRRTRSTTRTWR